MGYAQRLTLIEEAAVVAALRKSKSRSEVSRDFRINESQVQSIARRYGVRKLCRGCKYHPGS